MASFAIPIESLPSEIFSAICGFLVGYDLLALSHVSSSLFTGNLAPNGDVWKLRLGAGHQYDASLESAKKLYFASCSYQFPGTPVAGQHHRWRGGGACLAPWSILFSYAETRAFTISIRFALARDTRGKYTGGILLGAQSLHLDTRAWPHFHQQFIHVDPRGNLYCSITNTKEIVATNLQRERWYHVVLTYDGRQSQDGTQHVYLDGELVDTHQGVLHREWDCVRTWQIGTGCISGGAKGEPTPGHCGWYAFDGLVDSASLWLRALPADQVRRLYRGETEDPIPEFEAPIVGEERRSWVESFDGDVKRVRCSRPSETVAQVFAKRVVASPDQEQVSAFTLHMPIRHYPSRPVHRTTCDQLDRNDSSTWTRPVAAGKKRKRG